MGLIMDLRKLAKEIVKNAEWYEEKHGVEIDEHFAAYSLIKEIGQFADSILLSQGKIKQSRQVQPGEAKERLSQELVDIIALALINADIYDIDIDEEIRKRWVAKTGT